MATSLPHNGSFARASISYVNAKDIPEPHIVYGGLLNAADPNVQTHPGYETIDDIRVFDVRGQEDSCSLEKHGITFVSCQKPAISPGSQNNDIACYLQATASLLKQSQGADVVLCYDYKFRQNGAPNMSKEGPWNDRTRFAGAAKEVHVDATAAGGPRRIKKYLSESEIQKYFNPSAPWRMQIVNSWQPTDHVVEDRPLAFCDYNSIDRTDLITVKMHTSIKDEGELYHLRYNCNQKWYYLSRQQPDEMTIFKSYDSQPGDEPVCKSARPC